MRILLQRVNHASVTVSGSIVGAIERGLLLFVGFGKIDTPENFEKAADKVSTMRIFPDNEGRFHFSVKDINGGVLLVPQFTLYADTSKGRRPEFFSALEPGSAAEYFKKLVAVFQGCGLAKVACGEFGAHMQVALENDGPVTIMLEW